jgi:hypothetical protein
MTKRRVEVMPLVPLEGQAAPVPKAVANKTRVRDDRCNRGDSHRYNRWPPETDKNVLHGNTCRAAQRCGSPTAAQRWVSTEKDIQTRATYRTQNEGGG